MTTCIVKQGTIKVMLVTGDDCLDDVLDVMMQAIKGCGFHPTGELEIINEE